MYTRTLPEVLPFDVTSPVMFDTETMYNFGGTTRLVQLHQSGTTLILDCYYISVEDIKTILKPYTLVAHNIHYDLSCKDFAGWLPDGIHDTMHLARIKLPALDKFDLGTVADHFGLTKGEEGASNWAQPLTDEQLKYAAEDVENLQVIFDNLYDADDISYKLDMISMRYALRYQLNGVPIHRKNLLSLKRRATSALNKANAKIPQDLNINSPKQLTAFFETQKADKETMNSLSLAGNDIATAILEAKKYDKQLNFISKFDAPRIYGYLHPSMAKSGRWTSKGLPGANPLSQNIQQLPRDLKSALGVDDGRWLVDCDYGAIEMVTAAGILGENTLCKFIQAGKDIHIETAKLIYNDNTLTKEANKKERQIAKSANFGLLFAGGAAMFQGYVKTTTGIILSMDEAEEIRSKWLNTYPEIAKWHKRLVQQMFHMKKQYLIVETVLGRKMRANTLNDAANLPIQGTASEALKLAIHYLYEALPTARIVNVVHDQIVLECMSKDEAEQQAPILEAAMIKGWEQVAQYMKVQLPIKAEAEVVKTLGE